MDTRKSREDVRTELETSKAAKAVKAAKAEAYQVAYKAAALARRDKLAAEGAKPDAPEAKP